MKGQRDIPAPKAMAGELGPPNRPGLTPGSCPLTTVAWVLAIGDRCGDEGVLVLDTG
jgi:hypothetical protein